MTQTKNGNGCLLIVIAIVVIGWLWGKINYAYTHYNEPDRASDNQVHEKNIKQNQLDGFKVPESCSYLGSLSGYEPNDYKGSYRWQRLTNAAAQQGVVTDGQAHRALADVMMTLGVLQAMARQRVGGEA